MRGKALAILEGVSFVFEDDLDVLDEEDALGAFAFFSFSFF